MILKNKKYIVTGGSFGIGYEISKEIAKNGGSVIICARNEEFIIKSKNEIDKINNINNYYYRLDVSNYNEIISFKNYLEKNHEKIDGLINCAGIYGPIGKTNNLDIKEFEQAININFMGTVYMTHMFLNLKNLNDRKKIINFSGGGSTNSFPNYTAYSCSKISIVKFTENLALELKDDNVNINCISPGFINTRIHQKTLELGPDIVGNDFYNYTLKEINSGGSSPLKSAKLVIFLLTDISNNINGKLISAIWDDWNDEKIFNLLENNKDFATLRRIDEKIFYKK